MNHHTHGRVANQLHHLRQQLENQGLCLGQLLPKEQVHAAMDRCQLVFRQRLYTPLVTLWIFLYQVLSPDQSCRAAVARLLAALGAGGMDGINAQTDPYCKARQRLPENLVADLARQSGAELHRQVPAVGLLGGRPIKIADGTTVSMPDTPANQTAYPQQRSQPPGLGFPIIRLVGLICLSCGAVLDVAMAPYHGKQTGETALLRQLFGSLRVGDVLLLDACYAHYWMIVLLQERGVDVVCHHDGRHQVDFRSGISLGRQDHVVEWRKPQRPEWMSRERYEVMPETLSLREARVEIAQKGFRLRWLLLLTTLLDRQQYPKEDLAAVYRARWQAELDLRSIKQVMQMDVLRCKSPAMVRKEIWMHLLAYNLVRKLMAQAAATANISPRQVSFKGTLQTLLAFAASGRFNTARHWRQLYPMILQAVASHRVGDRPDRVEPRAVKRRSKKLVYLMVPRATAIAHLLKRR